MSSSLFAVTHVVAEWRLDSLMSVVFLEGESSSTGEMKPSASSSMWSRKPSTLRSGRTVTVNWVFESPSSSEPSSSSCRSTQRVKRWPGVGGWKRPYRAAALKPRLPPGSNTAVREDRAVLVIDGYKNHHGPAAKCTSTTLVCDSVRVSMYRWS